MLKTVTRIRGIVAELFELDNLTISYKEDKDGGFSLSVKVIEESKDTDINPISFIHLENDSDKLDADVRCPECGSKDISKIEDSLRSNYNSYYCNNCSYHFFIPKEN